MLFAFVLSQAKGCIVCCLSKYSVADTEPLTVCTSGLCGTDPVLGHVIEEFRVEVVRVEVVRVATAGGFVARGKRVAS